MTFVFGIWPEPQSEPLPTAFLHPMDIAETHVQNGKLDEAIVAFTQAIKIDPQIEEAWHEKGKLLNRLGYCNDAQVHYESYVERYPDSTRAQEGQQIANNC